MPIGSRYTDNRCWRLDSSYTTTSTNTTQPIYVWAGAAAATIAASSTSWPVYPLNGGHDRTWNAWVVHPNLYQQIAAPLGVPAPAIEVPQRPAPPPQSPAARARSLLESVLSAEQNAELERHGYFHVIGSRGNRYRIRAAGTNGNVDWVDDNGRVLGRLCAHPNDYLPEHDHYLAQMLALQHDEDSFVSIANVHTGRRPELLPAA